MLNIYSPMATGEILDYKVLKGVVENKANLCIVTTDRPNNIHSERNKAANVEKILKIIPKHTDLFLMDSDVVLPNGSISSMKDKLLEYPIVTIPTKPAHTIGTFPDVMPHAVMALRKEMIETFSRYLLEDSCFVCAFLHDYKPHVLWNIRGYEVK